MSDNADAKAEVATSTSHHPAPQQQSRQGRGEPRERRPPRSKPVGGASRGEFDLPQGTAMINGMLVNTSSLPVMDPMMAFMMGYGGYGFNPYGMPPAMPFMPPFAPHPGMRPRTAPGKPRFLGGRAQQLCPTVASGSQCQQRFVHSWD